MVEIWKEYPLTPLRTLVVRVGGWMTASASCGHVEAEGGQGVHRLVLSQGGVCVWLRGCEVLATTGADVDAVGESTRLVVAVTAP